MVPIVREALQMHRGGADDVLGALTGAALLAAEKPLATGLVGRQRSCLHTLKESKRCTAQRAHKSGVSRSFSRKRPRR
jgi:hypothetical protein